jgi:hypothetical protein
MVACVEDGFRWCSMATREADSDYQIGERERGLGTMDWGKGVNGVVFNKKPRG